MIRMGKTTTGCDHNGFTLVELMLVIGIGAVLMAVAYPVSITALRSYRLRAEVYEMVVNCKRAKLEAVKSNRNVILAFTPATGDHPGSYQVFVDANTNNRFDPGVDRILASRSMAGGLVLDGFKKDRATYNPNGRSSANSGDIRLADNSKGYRLVLSSTGAVRVASVTPGRAEKGR